MKPASDSPRAARREDLAAVRAISAQSPTSAGWALAQFEEELSRPRSVFLVAGEEAVAGYGVLWAVEGEGQVLDVAVDPRRRREGVGRAIMTGLIEGARRLGCRSATLEVSELNAPARALYERLGFRVVGRRAKFYNGADAVLMDLTL